MYVPGHIIRFLCRNKVRLWDVALSEEKLPLEEAKSVQWERTQKIILHAYENTRLYREKFDRAGIRPGDIRVPEDLKRIPITTKEEMLSFFPEGVTAANIPRQRWQANRTSGSSGTPFAYYNDRWQDDEETKALFRFNNAMHVNIGDVQVWMRNSPIKGEGIRHWLKQRCGNTKYVTTKGLSQQNLPELFEKVRSLRPKCIISFPHHIMALAEYMATEQRYMFVPALYIAGGNVTPEQKKLLESVFGGKVFNEYGASECMRIAYQCENREAYHLEMLRYNIEILSKGRDARKGELGEIVVTNLFNYVMPFIRYRIKDIAVAGEACSCGRTFPVIAAIKGRVQQAIFLPDGRFLDPNLVREAVSRNHELVSNFQSTYTKEKNLLIQVVPRHALSHEETDKLRKDVLSLIKAKVKVEIRVVESIRLYGEEQKEMQTLTETPPDLTRVV